MLACSAMVACTNTDEPEVDNAGAKGNEYYVSVAFSMPGSSPSRAASLGGYEDGAATDYTVNNAVFFFLNDAGNSVADKCYVPNTTFAWDTQLQNPADDEVAALTNSVIVMKNPTEIPSRIVAVVNTGDILGNRPTLTEIQNVANTYVTTTHTAVPTTGMVMSSTSYMDANNKLVIGAPVSANNIYESREQLNKDIKQTSTDAMAAKAVIIPVEKVLAKVTVSEKKTDGESDMTIEENVLSSLTGAGATAGEATTKTDNVELTISIDGWWLDSTPTQSYLLKNMSNFAVTGSWWNDIANTRSYWATSYAGTDQAYANDTYGKQADLDASLYTQENTSMAAAKTEQKDDKNDNVYEVNNRTKVVVAATLKQNGSAVDLVKWYGNYYTKDGFLISLANLNDVKKYYTRTGEGTETSQFVYTTLTKDNLKIVYNTDKTGAGAEIGSSNQDNVLVDSEAIRNYEAAVVLADGVEVYTLSVGADGKTVGTKATTATVNEELKKISKMQYWNGGRTYYYVELEHNSADSNAAFGVVRNHSYKLTLDGIKGLGTPVPNPEKVIIPEKPGDDYSETYISAKIQILSYRVVSQNVTLQ